MYKRAGAERLYAARMGLGCIERGDVGVTPGFNLGAKWIIHAVAARWRGGAFGEEAILRNCYQKSLAEALRLGCRNVAFPLLATGNYDFPRNLAMRIALEEIHAFLLRDDVDMDVYLVIYDAASLAVSGKIQQDIPALIDDAYERDNAVNAFMPFGDAPIPVPRADEREEPAHAAGNGARKTGNPAPDAKNSVHERERADSAHGSAPHGTGNETRGTENPPRSAEIARGANDAVRGTKHAAPGAQDSARRAKNPARDAAFADALHAFIAQKGMRPADIWRNANLDRRRFSKVLGGQHPSRETAILLAIGLSLTAEEADDLLAAAGYALSPASEADRIIRSFFESGRYTLASIETELLARTGHAITDAPSS